MNKFAIALIPLTGLYASAALPPTWAEDRTPAIEPQPNTDVIRAVESDPATAPNPGAKVIRDIDPETDSKPNFGQPQETDLNPEPTLEVKQSPTFNRDTDFPRAEDLDRKLTKGEKEVAEATEVFEKIMSDPDTRIPADLLAQSEGIAIIPGVIQAGFFLGARRGSGIMMLRYPNGTWSNPVFVKLTGGSLGLQFGAKSSDIIMVFPSRRTVNEVLNSSYDIGGSISGVAGPVGGTAVDPTEQYSKEQIYTYSRSNGLFGGVSLDGSKLGLIRKTNRRFYGRRITARRIFRDPNLSAPIIVNSLRQILTESEQGTYNRY